MTLICFCPVLLFSNITYILFTGLCGSTLGKIVRRPEVVIFSKCGRNHDALSHQHDNERNKKNIRSEFVCPKVLLLTMAS